MSLSEKEKRICKNCKNLFVPKTIRHQYCSRKCFKSDYIKKKKVNKFPSFNCPNCGKKTELNFDPKKKGLEWYSFICPNCKNN